ncbi:MAG: hypothetical protein JST30_17265 [Armatimonadetes bacterium]|nr:hypothetical protein [Armatimonadota bacterium]
MTALVALAVLAPQNQPGIKYWTLDDFVAGPYSTVMQGTSDIYAKVFNLDRAHCAFGERGISVDITSNPKHTTLSVDVGAGRKSLIAGDQLTYLHAVDYGASGTLDMDFSLVDRFYFECYVIPDQSNIYVEDKSFHGGSAGWLLHPKGIYFRKQDFPTGIDWKHISYLRFRQWFNQLPNPLDFTSTLFYATMKPGAVPPASLALPKEAIRH